MLRDQPPSLLRFAFYGKPFGGLEPHFKAYKSAAFEGWRSHLRAAQALTCLFRLLDCASLIALVLGMMLVGLGQGLEGHAQRGLSFLQLGLRQLQRLCYQGRPLPRWEALPRGNPSAACASQRKRDPLDCRIEFSPITAFSS